MLIDTCQGGGNPVIDSVPIEPQMREESERKDVENAAAERDQQQSTPKIG